MAITITSAQERRWTFSSRGWVLSLSEFKSFYKDQAAVEAIRFLGENRLLAKRPFPSGTLLAY